MDELKTKVLWFVELNKRLDMEEVEENHSYDEFNMLYPDLKYIGIVYTNMFDEKHDIQFELNFWGFYGCSVRKRQRNKLLWLYKKTEVQIRGVI